MSFAILFGSADVALSQTTAPAIEANNYQPPPVTGFSPYMRYGTARVFDLPEIPVDPSTVAQQVSSVIQIDQPAVMAQTNAQYYVTGYMLPNGGADASSFAVAVITSTQVIDGASDAAMHLLPDQRQSQVRVRATVVGPQLFRLEVYLLKGDTHFDDGDAQKILAKLCDQLTHAFQQSAQARSQTLALQAQQNTKEINAVTLQLADIRTKLRVDQQKTSTISPMYGDVSNTLANTRMQRQNTAAELERSSARLAQIDATSSNTIITQWDALVAQDQQRLQEMTASHSAGTATEDQVKSAEARLNDAQAHLLAARQQSDLSNDNNRGFRNQEAAGLKTTITEEQARLAQYDETIAKLNDPSFLEVLDEERELQTTEMNLTSQIAQLQSRGTQTFAAPADGPTVTLTVLDGKIK